ncbi:hypothetical protein HZB89_01070 [archaeon]|nr:hypothetical protein [archaeon]
MFIYLKKHTKHFQIFEGLLGLADEAFNSELIQVLGKGKAGNFFEARQEIFRQLGFVEG